MDFDRTVHRLIAKSQKGKQSSHSRINCVRDVTKEQLFKPTTNAEIGGHTGVFERSYPQSPEMESVDQTTDALIQDENAASKPESGSSSAAKAAEDILIAIDEGIGKTPETEYVKDLVRKMEKAFRDNEEEKKQNLSS